MLRYLTAGESHGECLTAVIEGLPAGLRIDAATINRALRRRQGGHGRGGRLLIESDEVHITSGVRGGTTLGSPLALVIPNRDWENWTDVMAVAGAVTGPAVTVPRPGHADLPGALKYGHRDIRNVLERASARETAARVAVGAVAAVLLERFGVRIVGHVKAIGNVRASRQPGSIEKLAGAAESSPVRCADPAAARRMVTAIDRARAAKDTVGGVLEVRAAGAPPGLGSHVHWDRRLDGRLAAAVMGIPAVKGVAIGDAFANAGLPGSRVHDEIFRAARRGYFRRTNRAGGIEGGMTNGEEIVLLAAVKPVPTLMRPLRSIDMRTGRAVRAHRERSDVCIVPAAAVIAEAAVAIELAKAFQEKFGGDTVSEMQRAFRGYVGSIRGF